MSSVLCLVVLSVENFSQKKVKVQPKGCHVFGGAKTGSGGVHRLRGEEKGSGMGN